MCHYIATAVEGKYPELKHTMVGSFIFLRFFNPTLVAPDSENLCKHIDNPKIRRALLLVTKVIQNLANDIVFTREKYVMIMNDCLNDHIDQMKGFLEEISVCQVVVVSFGSFRKHGLIFLIFLPM